jgi:TRAP-type C4-dicarboxylate transport system permease large subunit
MADASICGEPWIVMFVINVVFFVVGMFMDPLAGLVILFLPRLVYG